MTRLSRSRGGALSILTIILLYPLGAAASDLTTTIDLNYTYEQDHFGPDIRARTKVQQKYEIEYESALTPIFDILADIKLDIEEITGDVTQETTKRAPSLEISIVGPKTLLKGSYDASVLENKANFFNAESTTYANDYLLEFETEPDYYPEVKAKFERKRDYEELDSERVKREFELEVKKDINDLRLEFKLDSVQLDEFTPNLENDSELEWSAEAAYKSRVWWDVDVDLTYEVTENFSDDYLRGRLVDEDRKYLHDIQARLKKSLTFTPRLRADITYEYEFEQDLLYEEFDYELTQEFELKVEYDIFDWLEAEAITKREIEEIRNVLPEESEEKLKDDIKLSFDARPVDWLQITGKAEWELDEEILADTGASLETADDAVYEISVKQKWGRWWDLTVTGTSEYEFTDGWATRREGTVKADLKLRFFENLTIEPSYELERVVSYGEREPLLLIQERDEEAKIKFEYRKNFTNLIQTTFAHEFGYKWEEATDVFLNFGKVTELSEDTKIKVALVNLVRDLKLEGEVTRKATDTEFDDEPMLVDITYALKLDWSVKDLKLEASFKYDDNGDTFDESTLNTKVAWKRDNIDVSGEYQFDKVYAGDIDEERKLNLKMNVQF